MGIAGKTDWSGNDKVQHMTYVGEIIENHDIADYRGGICRLQSSEHIKGITTEECEANANLIAAAPDMYEALKEAYEFIADQYGDAESQAHEGEFLSSEARPIFKLICEAIAKAEGSK